MAKHRTLVGLHARNDVRFQEGDYELIKLAHIETVKMMSFTDVSVYGRLRRENPSIGFIVRLYDDRIHVNSRPSPAEFIAKMLPIINRLRPYAARFEIHNEPNHYDGIEGWGASEENARAFRSWYVQVLQSLKKACPWAQFGFPGLALNHPHRDLEWLDICRDAILASDWMGCHCYWQHDNMLSDAWGLRFKLYHERFPSTLLEITEFGNSTPNLSPNETAQQYARYYQELNKFPYLGSASAFIASSPDPAWAPFAWMEEGGGMQPVVQTVGDMPRQAVEVEEPWPPPKPSEPPPAPERKFSATGKTVRGSFLRFFEKFGLEICGYPITEQVTEDGVSSQYFQRLALEEYEPGKIRLKLVGVVAWTARQTIAKLEAQLKELREEFGLEAAPPQPDMEDIVDKLPKHASEEYDTRTRADIETIVIHHSATPPSVLPTTIASYHINKMDWPGIGYHFIVKADGRLFQTNRLETISYHAAKVNPRGVGVCFLGNFTSEVPTPAQLQAGASLVAWLMHELDIALDDVKGHREFMATACPGNQWLADKNWKEMLRKEIAGAQKASLKPAPANEPAGEPAAKQIYHYLLFLGQDARQTAGDWVGAQEYIRTFRPTIGFSAGDAVCAQYVTLIGGPPENSRQMRDWLQARGCQVDRVTGNPEASTVQILSRLVREGQRFWTIDV
jgi:N-acetyl-anhydromuramyl-L-alanine amidase AmpD